MHRHIFFANVLQNRTIGCFLCQMFLRRVAPDPLATSQISKQPPNCFTSGYATEENSEKKTRMIHLDTQAVCEV